MRGYRSTMQSVILDVNTVMKCHAACSIYSEWGAGRMWQNVTMQGKIPRGIQNDGAYSIKRF